MFPAKVVLAATVAFSAMAASCTVSTNDELVPIVSTGRLTLRWTINGVTDPNQCRQAAAPTLRISIFSGGAFIGDFVQSCEAFATTVDLNPGTYSGTVHLEDAAGQPRTTNIDLVPFRIIAGTNLDIPVDFPANSFF